MFDKVLITGGAGFVGGHFLSQLIANPSEQVICVAGRSNPFAIHTGGRTQFVPLDLSREIDLSNIAPDIVFHIAGEKRDESRMWEVNFEGTRRLLDWSLKQGVKRFVYLSSVGVYGAGKDSGEVTENTPKHPQNTYEASKNAAENWVRRNCPRHGIDYVILQPSNVIGAFEGKAYPLLGMMRMIKRGWFTYFDEGDACFNYVSVEDVTGGLLAAMSPQAANRTFILNSPVQMKQAVDWIADEIGVAPPSRRLPKALGFVAGELTSTLSRLTGISLPFSQGRFQELTNTTRYNGSAVAEATGFNYSVGIEAAMRKLARQYVTKGLL